MIKLKGTGIQDLENFDWNEYFAYNNSHLLKLNFEGDCKITEKEKKLITPSIQAFQIGEGSDGKHLMKVVKEYADKSEDSRYPDAMLWFITEENRHSNTLKYFMQEQGIPLQKKIWTDKIFRKLRSHFRLQCSVIVLVTAEMIALSYYTALAKVTSSKVMPIICKQMLNDELKHVVFQSFTLHKLSKQNTSLRNRMIRFFRSILMWGTLHVVWMQYHTILKAGGYTYTSFKKNCLGYLKQSKEIVKTGKV